MPLFGTTKAPAKKAIAAIIDIGSGSAGAGLVEIGAPMPILLAHARSALPLGGGRTGASLEARVLKAAREALQRVRSRPGAPSAARAAAFLPAPWSRVELHRIRFSRERPFIAEPQLIGRLVAEYVQARAGAASDAPVSEDVFERAVVGLRFNGYPAARVPHDEGVMQIEITLAEARAPRALLRSLRTLGEEFSGAQLEVYSSALCAARTAPLVAPDSADAFLCDGEGEVAEFILMRDAIPEAHATIPVGFSAIARTLALHGSFGPRELPSALALVSDPRSPLSAPAQETLAAAQDVCAQWLGTTEPLFASHAPPRAYVVGDGPQVGWFAEAMERSPRLRAALPAEFRVVVLGSRAFESRVENRMREEDPQLMLEALFISEGPAY